MPRVAVHGHDVGVVPQHSRAEIRGVREEAVEATKRRNGTIDERLHRLLLGDVEGHESRTLADGLRGAAPAVLVDVTDDHPRAGGGELARRLRPDPRRSSGHDDHLLLELCHTCPLPTGRRLHRASVRPPRSWWPARRHRAILGR